jgi:hypothetical protein
MHGLLTKWLEKRGIKSPEELDNTPMPDGSPTERETFENYKKILDKEELTLADVKEFCMTQIKTIEQKWADYSIDQNVKAQYIPYHTVYNAILNAINSPRGMRETIERQLNSLIK